MTDEELLKTATCFTLIEYDSKKTSDCGLLLRELKVEYRGRGSWTIVHGSECLNRDNEWEWEPSPSLRTDDFFERCRFTNREDAIEFALDHIKKYPSGYKP